jgi:cardiolipin synthase
MVVAKQVADLLTLSRLALLLVYTWVGLVLGAPGLPLAGLLLVYSWTTDILDGPLARRSRRYYPSWLGDHDLEVDMAVATGVMLYLLLARYLSLPLGAIYALLWVFVFWRWGLQRSPGMLYQTPLYAMLIWICLQNAFYIGLIQVLWVLAAVIVTWPRFPREVVPGFLAGFRVIFHKKPG